MKTFILLMITLLSIKTWAMSWQPLENGYEIEIKDKTIFTQEDAKIGQSEVKCSTLFTEGHYWVTIKAQGTTKLAIKVDRDKDALKIIQTLVKSNVCDYY